MKNRKNIVIFGCLIMFSGFLWAQKKLPFAPPSKENTYLFSIYKYNRQPTPPIWMKKKIEEIVTIPVGDWTSKDSLYYAYENVYLQKFGKALSLFARLKTDTIRSKAGQILYRVALQETKRFKKLLAYNKTTLKDNSKRYYSYYDAFNAITKAYIKKEKGNFYYDSTLVFPILKDSMWEDFRRNAPIPNNKFSQISDAIDSAFRQFTILHKDPDRILAQAFKEAGEFQKKYLYLTNAFFYYSAALHYYKRDAPLIKNLNAVINEMDNRNYISIKFPVLFGKIANNRYGFTEHLTKKTRVEKIKESDIQIPKIKKAKDYLPNIQLSLLYIAIFMIVLLGVLLFVRTNKK